MRDYKWQDDYELEINGQLRTLKPRKSINGNGLIINKPSDATVLPYGYYYSEQTVEKALSMATRFVIRDNSNGMYVSALNSIDSFETTKHVEYALRLTRRESELFFKRQAKLGNHFNMIIDLEKEGLL